MFRASLKYMIITLLAVAIVSFLIAIALKTPGILERNATEPTLGEKPQPESTERPVPTATPEPTRTPLPTPSPTPTLRPLTPEEKVERVLDGMTLEEKVGQLVMFGFAGTTTPNEAFTDLWQRYPIGNIVLYGSNIQSGDADGGFAAARRLTETLEMQNPAPAPLLVSIDVEGGTVVRFHWPEWPESPRTLGENQDSAQAYQQFLTIAGGLRDTGINMNLAPVLDVAPSPMDTFLKTRIISADAEVAGTIGRSMIRGLKDGHCLSTAKHFPGHGGTAADSHEVTPVVNKSLAELQSYDLVPFITAIDAGVDAIMVAHISYPALDDAHVATQSSAIMTELLREELGFTGIIISDDFRMKGLTRTVSVDEAAVNFILAGGDMILCGAVPEKQKAILDSLIKSARSGQLSEERIDASVRRILLKKMTYMPWEVPEA